MVGIVAVAATLATVSGPSSPAQRCDSHETPATIGGRAVCLSPVAPCRARYQKSYRKYGFRCRDGSLEYDWSALYRPLHVPRLVAGAPCPASAPRRKVHPAVSVNISRAFGPGPAYPTLSVRSGHAAVVMVWPPTEPPYLGWAGTKVLWTVPLYTGAVLVRGRQLDGPNRVGFDLGPGWTNRVLPEIRLVGPEEGLHPAATFVRTPGCYAYQVDTLRSSYLIVFDAQLGYR
jgi:hypothetical protein